MPKPAQMRWILADKAAGRAGLPVLRFRRCAAISVSIAMLAAAPVHASPHGWADASDIGRDVLISAALAVPAVQGDWHGDIEAGASIVVAGGAAWALKEAFPEERPDHSDRKSFPSGHSAEAFAAAATLENRYGWRAGLPAFAVASFVATARVEARKHHWYDAVAGAAIGTGSGFLLTRRHDSGVRLLPWADSQGGGMALAARF
ncbi:phosphatase PAP2 family protein [Sphingomonas sp. PR090111-T3T-6A]|uniref:phosphatase PAP2 family protein n=1 Tax=Sphingomonas sp. PR090111-T3T-6A TaxID=685778 RepID=UPI000377B5FF|nr:phosphatase PAP2 family protein [Sphingomonas sp. PR090111-T3T-6A]